MHHKTTAVHDERLCGDQLNGQKSGETNVLCACMKCVSTCALSGFMHVHVSHGNIHCTTYDLSP